MTDTPNHAAIHKADFHRYRNAFLKASERLSPNTWTQNWDACDEAGHELPFDDPKACRFCVLSAVIRHIEPAPGLPDLRYIRDVLNRAAAQISHNAHQEVFAFNDDPKTTLADIQALLATATGLVWYDAGSSSWLPANGAEAGTGAERLSDDLIQEIVIQAWQEIHQGRS